MKQAGFSLILVVVFIAVAAMGGYLVYQNQAKSTSTPQPSNQAITQPSPSPSLNASPAPNGTGETVNWEAYTKNAISLNDILKKINFEIEWDGISYSRYKYTAVLKGGDGKILKKRAIDVSVLGWDLGLLQSGNQTSFIYNPNTDTIILPLVSLPGGIGGNKPEGVLPDSPYTFAIYTTTFKENDKLNLVYSTEDIFDLTSYIIDLDNNILYLSTKLFNSTLYSFDLNSRQMKSLMNTQMHKYNDAYEQVNYGDLLFSKDQKYLIQKFYYYLKNPPRTKEGYILYDLKTNKGQIKYIR